MANTPQDVQAKLDAAVINLEQTSTTGINFVKQHGKDWTKWPQTSSWYKAFKAIYGAREEVGLLIAPTPPTAEFTHQVV